MNKKNFIITKYSARSEIISTTNPYDPTGAFANEIQWLNELGAEDWRQIGEGLWELLRKKYLNC